MKHHANTIMAVLVLLTLAVVVGCGSSIGDITGKVTLDGKELKGIEVNFEPIDMGDDVTTGTGYTQADGTYKIHYPGDKTGVPAGEYSVSISGSEVDEESGEQIKIPAKYNRETTLKRTVVAGDNVFDFELTTTEDE